jgi:hypothetical protein
LTRRYLIRLTSKRMRTLSCWPFVVLALLLPATIAGCMQDQINANNQQLAAEQTELDQLKQQVTALQNQGGSATYATPPVGPNACDPAVMKEATRKGGERMGAGDPVAAEGYCQDAVTACPGSAQAQLNLAHAYELTGDSSSALQHYRLAAAASGLQADPAAVQKARDALTRLGS